jgi:hypothetical protein
MAISFISSDMADGASSMTLSTHQADDLIIILSRRANSTPPDLPASGWTNIHGSGTASTGFRMGFRIATSSSDTSGTWTNAAGLACAVFRGIALADPIGATGGPENGASTSGTMPALTLQVTDGTSWVYGGMCCLDGAAAMAFSNMTRRQIVTAGGAGAERGGIFDTNGGVASWAQQSGTIQDTAAAWRSFSVEILAASAGGLGWKLAGGRSRLAGRGGLAG